MASHKAMVSSAHDMYNAISFYLYCRENPCGTLQAQMSQDLEVASAFQSVMAAMNNADLEPTREYYRLTCDGVEIDAEWNFFKSFDDAVVCFIQHMMRKSAHCVYAVTKIIKESIPFEAGKPGLEQS